MQSSASCCAPAETQRLQEVDVCFALDGQSIPDVRAASSHSTLEKSADCILAFSGQRGSLGTHSKHHARCREHAPHRPRLTSHSCYWCSVHISGRGMARKGRSCSFSANLGLTSALAISVEPVQTSVIISSRSFGAGARILPQQPLAVPINPTSLTPGMDHRDPTATADHGHVSLTFPHSTYIDCLLRTSLELVSRNSLWRRPMKSPRTSCCTGLVYLDAANSSVWSSKRLLSPTRMSPTSMKMVSRVPGLRLGIF